MEINIEKSDIYWGYAALAFNFGVGLLTLPLILNKLSADEVGMNYLMMSVASMVALFDCGFSGLLGRNVTYVLSGAQSVSKLGINDDVNPENVNYKLLSIIIDTAKYVYKRISVIVLIFLLTFGTGYMHYVTNGFTNIEHSFWIWIIFSVATFFNMYYIYYNSLLTGAALVKESKQATVFSKLLYLVICYVMLICGCGLFSVVVATLVSPFLQRWYCYKKFYTKELKSAIDRYKTTKTERNEAFEKIWYTAKRLAINAIGTYACAQSGTFISGMFLGLGEVASYGLMVQLFSVLVGVSANLFQTYNVLFCKLRVQGLHQQLREKISASMMLLIYFYIIGASLIIFLAPFGLVLLKSDSTLPSQSIMLFYAFEVLLSSIHSQSAIFITTGNKVPFVNASLYAGFAIICLSTLLLYLNLGIWSLVLPPFLVHSLYNHWFWPRWVLKEINMNPVDFFKKGTSIILRNSLKIFSV